MTTKMNLRMPCELKNEIDKIAHENNMPTSVYVRSIFENHLNNLSNFQEIEEEKEEEFNKEETEENGDYYRQLYLELLDNEIEVPDLTYSIDFIQLICWIYDLKSASTKTHTMEKYKQFQKTIIKINNDETFNENLKKELNKVLSGLLKLGDDSFLVGIQLTFTNPFINLGFNYEILDKFLFDRNNKALDVEL